MGLHYIFIPLINQCFKEFINSWNNHPIVQQVTSHHRNCLLQGVYFCKNSQIPGLDFFHLVDETYGIDAVGPISLSEDLQSVSIPQSPLRFSDTDIQSLRGLIDRCAVSENYGIDLYEETLQFISTLTLVAN